MTTSDFERIGGAEALRKIVADFVGRVFEDVMIGFHFRNASQARVTEKEFEHAAEHLGGPVRYSGRPLQEAHAKHPILGGQFVRRLKILEETLEAHQVPLEVRQRWLRHDEGLRRLITENGSDCDAQARRLGGASGSPNA